MLHDSAENYCTTRVLLSTAVLPSIFSFFKNKKNLPLKKGKMVQQWFQRPHVSDTVFVFVAFNINTEKLCVPSHVMNCLLCYFFFPSDKPCCHPLGGFWASSSFSLSSGDLCLRLFLLWHGWHVFCTVQTKTCGQQLFTSTRAFLSMCAAVCQL